MRSPTGGAASIIPNHLVFVSESGHSESIIFDEHAITGPQASPLTTLKTKVNACEHEAIIIMEIPLTIIENKSIFFAPILSAINPPGI